MKRTVASILFVAVAALISAATDSCAKETEQERAFSISGRALSQSLKETDFANDPRAYALLIDGTYDFNYDKGSSWRPHLSGGLGLAVSEDATSISAREKNMSPVFHVGGGIDYLLGEKWNLSLNYNATLAAPYSAADDIFTGRGQQPVDMQSLNMGMRYRF